MFVNFFSKRILYSPWVLAMVPAILMLFILPPLGKQYKLVIEGGSIFNTTRFIDLNSDGITEQISYGKGTPLYHVLVQDNSGRFYDQWNLADELHPGISEPFFGNYDNDKYMEIYIFSLQGDSLFLNVNEFFDPSGLKTERLFIGFLGVVDGTLTTVMRPAGFYDVTGDGFSELYFILQTGFALEPRHVYCLDISNKCLKYSDFTGAVFIDPKFIDTDGDNKPEIFGTFQAAGNYSVPTPYSDWSSWIMVYDENLNFEFPPVEFPGLTNNLEIFRYKNSGFRGYAVSHNTASADSNVMEPRIMIFSLNGEKLKEKLYNELGINSFAFLHVVEGTASDRLFVFESDLIELNSDLDIVNSTRLPLRSYYYSYAEDVDDDGKKEFIFYSDSEKKLVIYNTNLNMIAESDFSGSNNIFSFCHYRSTDMVHKLHITNPDFTSFVELKKNRYYYLGYLIFPGVYILIVLFISLIKKITISQIEQQQKLNQRLLTLQLQGIKSQLDPHFTFNSLNSIASLIYLEERQTAYDYLNKFTILMRRMLNDANRIYRSIGEEIDFVTTYLDLEKMRFGNKLAYNINSDKEVTGKESVPKLVLHTFAENAIKHGITPGEAGGMLQITVKRESDYLKIIIEDNGIGRERSAGKSLSTGKGLKLTGEFYDILNQLNKKPITHSIIDLYDDSGNPAGTRVEVFVPLDLKSDH